MLSFHLFRIMVHPPTQLNLHRPERSRSQILLETIRSLPSFELRSGMTWHIGNIMPVDSSGLYFRLGRTTKSTIEIYRDGKFIDEEFETAPYTHVFLDVQLEICAIAKRTRLSPYATGIANQLIRLLNKSRTAEYYHTFFEISSINDPEDFITHLKTSYAVSKFWVSFTKPNPFDVNSDFISPMQKLLREADAKKGKTEITGENLNPDSLESIARSAAATGDDSGAWVQSEPFAPIVTKYLKGSPVIITQEDLVDEEQIREFIERIRSAYQRIRGNDGK